MHQWIIFIIEPQLTLNIRDIFPMINTVQNTSFLLSAAMAFVSCICVIWDKNFSDILMKDECMHNKSSSLFTFTLLKNMHVFTHNIMNLQIEISYPLACCRNIIYVIQYHHVLIDALSEYHMHRCISSICIYIYVYNHHHHMLKRVR